MQDIADTKTVDMVESIDQATPTLRPGRKPGAAAQAVAMTLNNDAAAQAVATLDARAERVRAIALQVGYQLPGDGVDADLIQRDIAANMRRSVEACLEVGRGLVALKEACEYGEFGKRLEVLGIENRVAQRFMLAAKKFANAALAPHLTKAIGGQSKLFELLVLDADEVQELVAGGEVRGMDADDIAGMTRNELRAKLKEYKASLAAKDRVLADNATKINEQDVEIELLKNAPFVPREGSAARTRQEQALLDEVFRTSLRLAPRMKKLLLAADAALGDGKTSEAVQHAARAAVQFVTQQLADMAAELGITLDLDERVEAPWTEADAAALATLEARNTASQQ